MNTNVSVQIIKSVTAVICAAGICVGAYSSANKICSTNIDIASKNTSAPVSSAEAVSDEPVISDDISAEESIPAEETDVPADTDVAADETISESEPEIISDTSSSPKQSSSSSSTSKKASSSGVKSNVPSTKAEIINYCNTALNAVKTSRPGLTKKYVMEPKGPNEGYLNNLTGIVTKNETKTYKKGSDLTKEFPAADYSWSSKLREQDVTSAELKTVGQYYDIMIKLGQEKNPAKGEASSYGRVMSVIDVEAAKKKIPVGVKDLNMLYHDGYVHVKIDPKTGRVVEAEFSATADVDVTLSLFGESSAKNICSTETFTNFVW